MLKSISMALAGSMLLFAQSAAAQQGYTNPNQARFVYAVKFVCSLKNDSIKQGILPGVYATAINVHNPSLRDRVVYFKKFVRGLVEQEEGDPTKFVRHDVRPNHAFEVECGEIIRNLDGGTSAGVGAGPTATGFVVFMTRRPLDVTAVYTAGPLSSGEVSSIDVERIVPRQVRPQG